MFDNATKAIDIVLRKHIFPCHTLRKRVTDNIRENIKEIKNILVNRENIVSSQFKEYIYYC